EGNGCSRRPRSVGKTIPWRRISKGFLSTRYSEIAASVSRISIRSAENISAASPICSRRLERSSCACDLRMVCRFLGVIRDIQFIFILLYKQKKRIHPRRGEIFFFIAHYCHQKVNVGFETTPYKTVH